MVCLKEASLLPGPRGIRSSLGFESPVSKRDVIGKVQLCNCKTDYRIWQSCIAAIWNQIQKSCCKSIKLK